jgi:hypothetical protein
MNDGTLKIEKVTPIESKKPAPVATHTISYQLDGFAVTTTLETTASIADVISRLKAIGATPPSSKPSASLPSSEDAPICEFHGKLKKSQHGGWFCPKKMGDGSYCKSKA